MSSPPYTHQQFAMAEITQELSRVASMVNNLANKADVTGRRNIQDALMKLQHSLETPFETTMRMYDWHHRSMCVRMGSDLQIFKSLSESPKPLTVDDLVERNGAAPQLLGLLSYSALCLEAIFGARLCNSDTNIANQDVYWDTLLQRISSMRPIRIPSPQIRRPDGLRLMTWMGGSIYRKYRSLT